ncbi:MAG: glycosyltransferase [Rhodobacteraceae bacterium]|nr:glycosyltransferase [Paracoccaceae bacterium]
MRILLIHQNFPGQFLHLAPALAARGHQVLALTVEGNERPSPVPRVLYRKPEKPEGGSALARTYGEMAERGLRAARAAAAMTRDKGYVPDVILGHSGWGETLFLKDVWPEARLIVYSEFLYRAGGLDAGFDPEFQRRDLAARLPVTARAAHLLQALVQADAALAPTRWQADTVPAPLRDKIAVIHDGIDTDRARPDPAARFTLPSGRVLAPGDEVLSFVNRNLEPYRGYHVFMRALPAVLAARPEAQVVIVGGDGVSYGGRPADGRSWKQVLLDELGDRLDLSRVHFTGKLAYADYLALLQVARAHAYLTYPFVLSWSLMEAMAAGARIVASRTPPVQEMIRDGETGRLVEFFDIAGWSAALIDVLADPARADAMAAAARAKIVADYDLRRVCLPRLIDFVEGRAAG